MGLISLGNHATNLGCRRKERRSFAAYHLQIDRFISRQILRCGQLQHLALCNCGRGIGEDIQHAQRAGFNHQLEGPRKQIVAHQDRAFVVPQKIRGWAAPALGAFINHIVMQKRRGVNEFNRGGQMDVIGAVIAAKLCRGQGQQWTQTLAACTDQMRCHLGDARRMFAGHACGNQRVHLGHFPAQQSGEGLMWFMRCVIQTHNVPVTRVDKPRPVALHPKYERALTHHRSDDHSFCLSSPSGGGYRLL